LRELQPQLSQVMRSLELVEQVDVVGVEMALIYARPTAVAGEPPT
jgi:hypothetical protein